MQTGRYPNNGTCSWSCIQYQMSANSLDTLGNGPKAYALAAARSIETATVVGYLNGYHSLLPRQIYPNEGSGRILHGIAHGLLHDAVIFKTKRLGQLRPIDAIGCRIGNGQRIRQLEMVYIVVQHFM